MSPAACDTRGGAGGAGGVGGAGGATGGRGGITGDVCIVNVAVGGTIGFGLGSMLQQSRELADLAGVAPGQAVLDVGCGPGALTRELVWRVGPAAVAAVDPSAPFVEAARSRNPGVDVRQASAEAIATRAAASTAVAATHTSPASPVTTTRRTPWASSTPCSAVRPTSPDTGSRTEKPE